MSTINFSLMKFERAKDIEEKIREIGSKLEINLPFERIICFRSYGSKAKYTIGRCWSLPKIWQEALNVESHYIIEVISEKFDSLCEKDKIKVLIHELLHIPKAFGGGLKGHRNITKRRIEKLYEMYSKK